LPTHCVLNAMATTAYHNQFMRGLDKKCTILFLYGSASYICAQFALMEILKSNDCLQLAYICVPATLHAMLTTRLLYVNLTVTEPPL